MRKTGRGLGVGERAAVHAARVLSELGLVHRRLIDVHGRLSCLAWRCSPRVTQVGGRLRVVIVSGSIRSTIGLMLIGSTNLQAFQCK